MRERLGRIGRGTIERVRAATRALPMVGRRPPLGRPRRPAPDAEWPAEDEESAGAVSGHDQQHVNPARRQERGHPKR